ncbi:MAG TPA: SPOR domain-containing protein [Candidatus Acidoferrales bacterium]|jgi:cell division septation protein DedD|nr:SPOR domain-containing protein [Candidatus Acidoferrales bacterium]
MASGTKKGGGGDVILESRHLVGLFLMMVVIFGVVFVLGYELGRNQVSGQVRASDPTPEENTPAAGGSAIVPTAAPSPVPASSPAMKPVAPAKTAPSSAKNGNAKNGAPQPPAKTVAPNPQPVAPSTNKSAPPPTNPVKNAPAPAGGTLNGPLIPKGAVVLQVSALTVEGDALKMAQELQKKKFPAFVLAPGADHYYRVQVGPYMDMKSADKARAALEKEGFKPIVKR